MTVFLCHFPPQELRAGMLPFTPRGTMVAVIGGSLVLPSTGHATELHFVIRDLEGDLSAWSPRW